ncbi:hypothetical protein F7230_04085 [Corynebacterium sp. 320]|uniref:Uncharacterized protein n=1 Tax=Corynebacterium zhongnanshanii TaxID=2768834 RepID=A0ABQ6VEZ5_9CORY|nr:MULTISPECIES: DUF6541 family protein [Corynebacterium]KAB1504266.1 hypothetical protein F7230_04085 [Corynebacterium sp. 320]KAB1552634.1 hypothetical protein F7233_02505 [Corynebacterium sp. 321]KAB1554148.1 hypothetical protein F7232_04080 [Corynebacterium sp. 319]KAB3522878.1 hypothetical protein F8377_01525 [Corynebacterium zhongnanshanii]KAB3528402.1 hypothetical protein F8354_04085 [Corynebacterium sp. 250]
MALEPTWHLVLIALLVWALPGALLSMAAGLKPHRALVAALPVTAGVWGSLAALYGALGIPFTQLSAWIGTAVVVLLMLGWQVFFGRAARAARARRATGGGELGEAGELASDSEGTSPQPARDWMATLRTVSRPLLPALGVVSGAYLMISRGLNSMVNTPRGLESVFQGWDGQWHVSTIRFIMETHTASSTHMGELQNVETKAQLFYPAAWHTMVFMFREATDISPIAAVNIGAKVMPAVGIALTVSLLAWLMVRGATRRAGLGTAVAAFLAPIIAAGVLPLYYVSFYVGMWPYASAMSLIGPVIWLFCRIPSSPRMIVPAAVALAGVGMMHPAPITHIVLFVAVWWLGEGVLRRQSDASWGVTNKYLAPVVSRLRATLYIAGAGLCAVAIFLPQLLVGSNQTSEVSQFNTGESDTTRTGSWMRILYLQTRHAWEYGVDWWFLWAAAIGAVILLAWRRNLWPLAVFLIFAVIAVDAVRSFADPLGAMASAVGALHYNSAHRLVMPVAILMIVFAAGAVGFVFHLVFQIIPTAVKKNGQSIPPLVASTVTVGAVLALVVGAQIPPQHQEDKTVGMDHLLASAYDPRMVDTADLRAFDWLATQPKAYDGLILNNPDEGSGWMYAYNGLPALHRHYLFPSVGQESATTLLYWHPDVLGRGMPPVPGSPAEAALAEGRSAKGLEGDRSDYKNTVDKAVDELNVNYIVFGPPHFWSWQKDIIGQGPFLYDAPGVTPIYQDGALYIYAVNAHFTQDELDQMVKDSPRKPTHPPVQAPDAVNSAPAKPHGAEH